MAVGTEARPSRPFGLWVGSTENARVGTDLLQNIIERGLKVDDPIRCVIDGGKGIRKALRDVWGDLAVVQRCQVHKLRNVRDQLPDHRHMHVTRVMRDAYGSASAVTVRPTTSFGAGSEGAVSRA